MGLPTINGLSLFSGIGGLDLALRLVLPSYRVVCYVERDTAGASVLAQRMAEETLDPAPVWSDATTFDGQPWCSLVDIATAGYPCQPISSAGKGLGEKDERWLWPEVARIVSEVEPTLLFCENVSVHLRRGFYGVVRDLRDMGYTVAATLWSAQEVGAPHVRSRLFFLALANTRYIRFQTRSSGESSSGRQKGSTATEHGRGAISDDLGSVLWNQPGRCDGADRQEEPAEDGKGWRSPFPPSPGDLDGWRRFFFGAGELGGLGAQPAIRRSADGVSAGVDLCLSETGVRGLACDCTRKDRIYALGNAVVPIQGALAFLELAEALGLTAREPHEADSSCETDAAEK